MDGIIFKVQENALIALNATLIVQMVSFLIFLFILNRVMIRPILAVMDERKNYMDGLKQSVSNSEKEVEDVSSQLQERESVARKESLQIKKKLEDSGTNVGVETINTAANEISMLKEEAEKEVQVQITEARKFMKKESENLAVNIMEKILDRRLNP
jgi:F-type H+-transporting ATPase subunit b